MDRRPFIVLAILSFLSLGLYLGASHQTFRLGFPLDDAWIHQVYARNLVRQGEWAFLSGQPSAGSTAPLWSVLLSGGYLLKVDPMLWTYLLGWLSLTTLAIIGYYAVPLYLAVRPHWALIAAVALTMEWHLVWAAGSGMETLLMANLITLLLVALTRERFNWFAIGLLVGISTWVRPDGLTLLGPAILVALLRGRNMGTRMRSLAAVGLGFALLFIPYLMFNRTVAGAWWPNTFYAKQREYAILRELPYLSRYLTQLQLPLVGLGALLLPGFLLFVRRAWIKENVAALAGTLWWFGYIGIYAWRLPVTYQHGRYLIPAMPIYFIWGFSGMIWWLSAGQPSRWQRIIGRVWAASSALILVAFLWLGARAYARDVAFIETEMVAVANWVATETETDALIAAHDIGALGYFGGRPLLDLAGLVSPDVIPFIRDEDRLAAYLDSHRAEYLVTFPGWYPALVRRSSPVYQTGGSYSAELGGENMAVYRWIDPAESKSGSAGSD